MSAQSEWISVGELSESFSHDSHAPEPSSDLVGKQIQLRLDDGRVLDCRFEQGDTLWWRLAFEPFPDQPQKAAYRAVALREGIYFVDFVWERGEAHSVTILLDLNRAIATVLLARLPDESETRRSLLDRIATGDELTAVSATFHSASVDKPFDADTPRHLPSTDLVGRRVEYTYSPTERYEHIYLNESLYTWHCLAGSEKGLADTDRCHHLELADRLYLFVWREKIVPTLGVVAVDFIRMGTAGKILGYRDDGGLGVENFPVGARARLVDVIESA